MNKKTPPQAEQIPKKQKDIPQEQKPPKEIGGKEGPDPVRYGDWENNGIASDF